MAGLASNKGTQNPIAYLDESVVCITSFISLKRNHADRGCLRLFPCAAAIRLILPV